MAKFIKLCIILLSAILLLQVISDVIMTKCLRNNNSVKYAGWRTILNDSIEADIVINGSSRARTMYSPQILENKLKLSVYNLGIEGGGLNRQIIRYEIYCHNQKRPKYIIQNVDWFRTLEWIEGYQREQFFPWLFNGYTREKFRDIEPFSWGELYIPFYRYAELNIPEEIRSSEVSIYKGYSPHYLTWDGTANKQIKDYKCQISDKTISMFETYLKQVKRDSIDIVFVYAPIYIEATNKVTNLDEVYSTINNFALQYDIPVLDYTYHTISTDTTYFANATHLNKKGAEMFSNILANDLDSLWFSGND